MTNASRNWKAVETTDLVGSKHVLTVSGDVEVGKSNETPTLTEASPQGISQATLLLEVGVEGGGEIGADVMTWKCVQHVKEIMAGQYEAVTIRGAVDETTVQVEQVLS